MQLNRIVAMKVPISLLSVLCLFNGSCCTASMTLSETAALEMSDIIQFLKLSDAFLLNITALNLGKVWCYRRIRYVF